MLKGIKVKEGSLDPKTPKINPDWFVLKNLINIMINFLSLNIRGISNSPSIRR